MIILLEPEYRLVHVRLNSGNSTELSIIEERHIYRQEGGVFRGADLLFMLELRDKFDAALPLVRRPYYARKWRPTGRFTVIDQDNVEVQL